MPEVRRILVVDDHEFVGRGIASQICADADVIRKCLDDPNLRIEARAVVSLKRAEQLLKSEDVNLVILDLDLSDNRSEEATLEEMATILQRTNRTAHIAIYSGRNINTHQCRRFLRKALKENKLKGVILKSTPADRVVEGLGRLLLGEEWYPVEVVRALANTDDVSQDGSKLGLTEREWQVAQLLSEGLPNKTIALRLNIGEAHTRQVVSDILEKLQANNRTVAAIRVYKELNGLPTG